MKKLNILLTLILCCFIILSTFSAAIAVNTNSNNYKTLVDNGFTEDYLNNLTDSMINKMAKKIKEIRDPDFIADYEYLLSLGIPEEFLAELSETALSRIRDFSDSGTVSEIDYTSGKAKSSDALIKKLSIQLTNETETSVLGETVCVYWEHEINKPILRDEDFVEASWNDEVFCYNADTFYAEDYRRSNTEESWTVSGSYSELATASLNSIGHWTKLYTTKKQVGGFMIFELCPTHPIDVSSDYDRSVSIDYSYAAETKDYSTVIMCIVFILLVLAVLTIITKVRKKKKR